MKSFLQELGFTSEGIACKYLKEKGYKIFQINYKNKLGEIDIIAQEKNTLVFVEVKSRLSTKFGLPREAINFYKQKKIKEVATVYLKQKKVI